MAARPAAGGDVFLPPAGGPQAAPNARILGLDRKVAIGLAVVVAAIGAYLVYRHFRGGGGGQTATAAAPSDQQGGTVPIDQGGGGASAPDTGLPPASGTDYGPAIIQGLGDILTQLQQQPTTLPSTNGSASGPAVTLNVIPQPEPSAPAPAVVTQPAGGGSVADWSGAAQIGGDIGAGLGSALGGGGGGGGSSGGAFQIGSAVSAGAANWDIHPAPAPPPKPAAPKPPPSAYGPGGPSQLH